MARCVVLASTLIVLPLVIAASWNPTDVPRASQSCHQTIPISDNVRPLTIVGAAFTATWGTAVLAMRLRRPRPRGTDWRRRPGFIAGVAAAAGCLAKLAALLIWGASVNLEYVTWYVPSILGLLIEPGLSWHVYGITRDSTKTNEEGRKPGGIKSGHGARILDRANHRSGDPRCTGASGPGFLESVYEKAR